MSEDGLADYNAKLGSFFRDTALLYLEGPPYEHRTHSDGLFYWQLDDFDGKTTWDGKVIEDEK